MPHSCSLSFRVCWVAVGIGPADLRTSRARQQWSLGWWERGQQCGKGARQLKTGFGQSEGYAWVTSLVENQAEDNVGQFVTVQFNLLDSDGEILARDRVRGREQLSRSRW
jgi:hypothetical protein